MESLDRDISTMLQWVKYFNSDSFIQLNAFQDLSAKVSKKDDIIDGIVLLEALT
jgi:hypothetical protein